MAQPQQHVIRTQVIDITMPERGLAHSVQETISALSRNELARETDAIFSRLCDPEVRVGIDRLELDLGALSLDRLKEDFLEKFGPALENALAAYLDRMRPASATGDAAGRVSGSIMELLAHLLVHGSAPWWWAAGGNRSLESIVLDAIAESPIELARLVRRIGQAYPVRRRMVLQLTDACLEALVRVLEPADAEFIIHYGRNLREEQEKTNFVQATRKDFRDASWELVLQHLLVERGTLFNQKSFLRSVVQGLAQRYGIAYEILLAHLAAAIQPETRIHRPGSLPIMLREIAREDLAQEHAPGDGSGASVAAESGEAAGAPELWAQFMEAWREMALERVRGLWARILLLTPAAEAARMLTSQLPPADWPAILRALGRAGDTEAFASLEPVFAEWHAEGRLGSEPWATVRQRLWRGAFAMAAAQAERLSSSVDPADAGRGDFEMAAAQAGRGDWRSLLRRFLSGIEAGEARARIFQRLLAAPAVAAHAELSQAVRDLASLDEERWRSMAPSETEFVREETPIPEDLARSWWKLPASRRLAMWEQIVLADSPEQVARKMTAISPPSAWREVLRAILAGTDLATVIALEEALREIHRDGTADRGAWDGVRSQLTLAIFERAAETAGAGGVWDAGDWLTLLRRFGSLIGDASRAGETWRALLATPALRSHAALARALRNIAALAGRTGFPLELAALRADPGLAIEVLETFASTGSIVPRGALGLLPGGPGALLIRLAMAHPEAAALLLRRLAAQPGGLGSFAARFSADALGALLTAVVPRDIGFILPYLALLVRHRATPFLHLGSAERSKTDVWLLMLEIIASQPASTPGAATMIGAHIDRLARRRGISRSDFATRLWRLARTESTSDTKVLSRILASLRSGQTSPGASSVTGDDASPALLRRSITARLAFWRSFLREGATGADASKAAFAELWKSAATDSLAIYRELLPQGRADVRWVEAAAEAGGEMFILQVVTAQAPVWISEFTQWLDFLDHLPAQDWLFPFPRHSLRSRMLIGVAEFFARPRSRRLSPAAVILEILAGMGLASRASKDPAALAKKLALPVEHVANALRGLSATQAVAFILLAFSLRDTRPPAPRIVKALRTAAGPALRAMAAKPSRTPAPPKSTPPPVPKKNPTPKRPLPADQVIEGPWFVHNAGLVLLAPYFPQFHRANGLLDGDLFRDEAAAQRAVLLLQSLLTADGVAAEHSLLLNKILCGLAVETPVPAEIELLDSERQNGETLLRSVLQNWPGARNLSLDGLRSSFLLRDGKVERQESSWRITVEARGYDVLLGSLPWTFSVIKPAWMPDPLYVEWV
jgi:hypothetical protein